MHFIAQFDNVTIIASFTFVSMLIIILTLGNSACVLLEGEAEDGDLLVSDRVEEALHDALGEAQSVMRTMMAMIFI